MNVVLEKGMEAGVHRLASRLLRKTDFDPDLLNAVVESTIKEIQMEGRATSTAEIKAELNSLYGHNLVAIFKGTK